MHLIFSATLSGYDHPADGVRHLLRPHESFYYVAASETMTSGVFPRILAYGSAVCVKRSWKEGERVIERDVDVEGFSNVSRAIRDGWVVTFPQGTTRPVAPGRIGTVHLIRTFKPIVVPVVLNGLHEAFGKTGLDFRGPARPVHVEFKAPLELDYGARSGTALPTLQQGRE